MQVQVVKKSLITEAITIGVILVLFAGTYSVILNRQITAEDDLKKVRHEAQRLDNNIRASKRRITDLSDAMELYKSIPAGRLPTEEGYAKDAFRIRAARSVLEPLRQKYKLNKLDITFSRTQEQPKQEEHSDYVIVSNEMDIGLAGSSDEIIFSFLYDMISDFKGYLHLTNLSLTKEPDVWKTVTETSSQQDAGFIDEIRPFNFVGGTATFTWQTIEGEPVKIDFEALLAEEGLL